MENVNQQWLSSGITQQQRFQNMLFPEGVVYDQEAGMFGTTKMSDLYGCIPTKKDLPEPEKSFLIEYVVSNWNLISAEIIRWKHALAETPIVWSS